MGQIVFVAEAQDVVVVEIKQIRCFVSLHVSVTKNDLPAVEVALVDCRSDGLFADWIPANGYLP